MMGVTGILARAELRRRWRPLATLIVVAGLPAGVAIAAASGASRTSSVVDRLVAQTKPPQIYMIPAFQDTKVAFRDVARLPVVSEALLFHGYGSLAPGPKDLEIGAPVGRELPRGRTHLIAGRSPRPDRVEEAVINFITVRRYHWKIGDIVPLTLAAVGADPTSDVPPAPGPSLRAKIVGINADPGDFVGIAGPGMSFGAGFDATYGTRAATLDLYVFSLAHGSADLPAFERGLRGLTGGRPLLYVDGSSGVAQARRTFHAQGAALWVLSLSLGLVAALIFGQSFARQSLIQSREHGTLRALGLARRDLLSFGLARAAAVAVVAATLAAIVAAALSPTMPLGTARLAEPNPGISLPGTTFGGGIAAAFAIVFLLALVPSLLAARRTSGDDPASRGSPSVIARLVGAITRRPAPAVGARFALEPGRGPTAVPVRTSLAATITGIVALLAALIVGASLQHLLHTPSLYGWNWDLTLAGNFSSGSKDLRDLTADGSVVAAAVGSGGGGAEFRVDGATTNGIAVDQIKGALGPTLLSGRVPQGIGEVALGPKILQAAHARIGSTVHVGLLGSPASIPLRVVGEAVLPFDDDVTSVGEGLWSTRVAIHRLFPEVPPDIALVRLAPAVDRTPAITRLKKRFPGEALTQAVPRTIRNFGTMSNLPVVLAALLAALATGTLAHMLATSIRRRRRDLAILKTIGFSRGQVRSAVGWQAIFFVLVALAVGVPGGILVGRWTWRVIAHYGGFAVAPAVPALQISIAAMIAIAVALLLATLPARAAARTRPAFVLRSE